MPWAFHGGPGGGLNPDQPPFPTPPKDTTAGGAPRPIPLSLQGVVVTNRAPEEEIDEGHLLTLPGSVKSSYNFPKRSRILSFQIFQTASRTMPLVIFDSPVSRPVKTMGISRGLNPFRQARSFISTWKV